MPEVAPDALTAVDLSEEQTQCALQFLIWRLEALSPWDRSGVEASIRFVCEGLEIKLKQLMPLVFLALSGRQQAISAFDLAILLGADRTRARLRQALEVSGGVSKKALKRLEKSYADACRAVDSTGEAH